MNNATRSKLLKLARANDDDAFLHALEGLDSDALFGLTAALEKQELYPKAQTVYRVLTEHDPTSSAAWRAWAGLERGLLGNAQRADQVLAEGLKHLPEDLEVLDARARILCYELGELEAAAGMFEQMIARFSPTDGGLYAAFGWTLLSLGRVTDGLVQLGRARSALQKSDEPRSEYTLCVTLENEFSWYLAGDAQERERALRTIAAVLRGKQRTGGYHCSAMIAQATAAGHPEVTHLAALLEAINGQRDVATLADWPAFRVASRRFRWPEGVEPGPLLCALDDLSLGEFSANVFLTADDDAAALVRDAKLANQLAVFAADGNGSCFALWLAPTAEVERAPVVFLAGDDPGETQVIAANIRDFLALLGLCVYDLATYARSDEPWAREAITERKEEPLWEPEKEFRSWLKEVGIKIPTAREAEAIIATAQQSHPSFREWLGL